MVRGKKFLYLDYCSVVKLKSLYVFERVVLVILENGYYIFDCFDFILLIYYV